MNLIFTLQLKICGDITEKARNIYNSIEIISKHNLTKISL